MHKTIVALYDSMADANAAVRDLTENGIPRHSISFVTNDASGEYSQYFSAREAGIEPVEGTTVGAGIGAVVGGLGGLLVGMGSLVIPGIGPVLAAGPLSAAIGGLVGAAAGSAAGGLLGALVDIGVPEETAGYYAEGLRRGGSIVTVNVDDQREAETRRILNAHNPVNLNERVRVWKEHGFATHQTSSAPYTRSEIEAEKAAYRSTTSMSDESHVKSPYTKPEFEQEMAEHEPLWQGNLSYSDIDAEFRHHYDANYARSGLPYSSYLPAYNFGYDLAHDPRYADWEWDRLENAARRDWDMRDDLRGAWEVFKDSVRYAWERGKQEVREALS